MYKSNHSFTIGGGIPVEELRNFINPINMTLFVPRSELYYVFGHTHTCNEYFFNYFKNVFSYIPSFPEGKVRSFTQLHTGITYTPHTDGYDFRFHPVDFMNELFKVLHVKYEIPFINLDNGYGMNYFKDYVRAYIRDFKLDKNNEKLENYDEIVDVLDDVNKNIDSIASMYYTNLDSLIEHNAIPKDMLLYLACAALDRFEETRDERYLVFAYEYYVNISHMNTSPYPHMVSIHGKTMWYGDFRTKYQSLYDPSIVINDNPYIIDNNEVLLAWDILEPGMLEREIRDINDKVRSNPNVDYDKYLRLFEIKMNYYLNSPYIKYIKGTYGLAGYVGFSYKNEYLLFDKFHNSDTIDPSKKTILTHGEAIYALPSDKFTIAKNKQRVIEEKQVDPRIKKINHVPNFTKRLDDIITGPNVSTTTFDKVIAQQKRRMLIK